MRIQGLTQLCREIRKASEQLKEEEERRGRTSWTLYTCGDRSRTLTRDSKEGKRGHSITTQYY
jgi:hypothetical protein